MAQLDLIPDPKIMVIQTGIFLANIYVVKKFYVEPYLKLKAKREFLTVGSQDQAQAAATEAGKLSAEIKARIDSFYSQSKAYAEDSRQKATLEQKAILHKAENEAKSTVEQTSSAIAQMLDEEKTKVPQIVDRISAQLFAQLLN